MKRTIFVLTILAVMSVPIITMAGIRKPLGECFIGTIKTSHAVAETRVTYGATIFIKDSAGEPVPGTLVEGIWRGKNRENLVPGKCTTDAKGECSIPHVVRLGEKPEGIPQRGIMVTGVDCPKLKYIYEPNTTFAWAVMGGENHE
jgi:hypothetical protein